MRLEGHQPWYLLVLLTTLLPCGVYAGTPLFQMLSTTGNVAQFTQVIKDSGLAVQMNGSQVCSGVLCLLVFAPNNAAMTAASMDPSFSAVDKVALVKNHFVSSYMSGSKGLLGTWGSGTAGSPDAPVGIDIGFGQVRILTTPTSTLFWLSKTTSSGTSYRVNNAAVVVAESDQQADNGVFHVIDQVLLPIGSQLTTSTFFSAAPADLKTTLSISKTLTTFNDWMSRDVANGLYYDALKGSTVYKVRTLFLPSDAAWARIPDAAMASLNSSPDDFRKVLLSHFAPRVCVFTSWMTLGSSISFNTGVDELQNYTAKMYLDSAQKSFVSVGGVVAQFVDKSINFPIADAVIHVVDRVLGFTYDTLATLAQANAPDFYSKCMTVASCQNLLTANDTTRTLFAPADLSPLNGINATLLEQILLLHFVPTTIGKPDMASLGLVTTQNNGQIRFRMIQNNSRYFVEGRLPNRGFVRGELLMFDQPAKNGIFHKIAFPLGQPRQTVQEFINSFEELSSVKAYMGINAFDPNLGAATTSFTVFPPNNAAVQAFSAYKSSSGANVGQTILSGVELRNRLFRRIVLPNQKLVIDVAASGANDYQTANTAESEKVSLNLQGSPGLGSRSATLTGVFVVTSVNTTAGLYECTNGMVYPVGNVLFRDNDIEGYTRSAGSVTSSLAVAVCTVVMACLAKL